VSAVAIVTSKYRGERFWGESRSSTLTKNKGGGSIDGQKKKAGAEGRREVLSETKTP